MTAIKTRAPANYASNFVSVKDFGAVGDGVTDDTAAFNAAIIAVPAVVVEEAAYINSGFLNAPTAQIIVPDGSYKLTSLLNGQGKNLIWQFSQGAVITNGNYQYLVGNVNRSGSRINASTASIRDDACGQSIHINKENAEAGVVGFITPCQLGLYAPRDAVAQMLYASPNKVITDQSGTTFTSTSVTFASAFDASRLKVGMIIDVLDNTQGGTKISGYVSGWNVSTRTINVNAWYVVNSGIAAGSLVQGTTYSIFITGTVNWTAIGASSATIGTTFTKNATAATGSGVAVQHATPVNGSRAIVNACTSVWALNPAVELGSSDYADNAIGCELNLYNNKSAPPGVGSAPIFWGFHTTSQGQYKVDAAYVADGSSTAGMYRGLYSKGCDVGVYVEGNGSILNAYNPGATVQKFAVNNDGSMELGYVGDGLQHQTYIDFHSGPFANDYDVRLLSEFGTNGVNGQGRFTISAAEVIHSGNVFYPNVDDTQEIGAINKRWTNVFSSKFRPGDGTATWTSGIGDPNGVGTAVVGSLYTRLDGGAGTTLYIKESGTGNTGWVAK